MRAPPKKRKRSVSVASDVQSAASSLTWASARMTAAHLEEFYEDPWSYTQKQVELVETCTPADLDRVADSMWAETSWQITASHVVGPRGMVKFNRRCAVTLKEEGDLESAHLVPARRENYFNGTFCRGQLDVRRPFALHLLSIFADRSLYSVAQIDVLKEVQVVPAYAHVNA